MNNKTKFKENIEIKEFESIDDIKNFITNLKHNKIKCDVKYGNFEVDGESLMGMINLIGKKVEIVYYKE